MSARQNNQKKEICRLCYCETNDAVDIFSEKGREFNYESKINKYLYLKVDIEDGLPRTVCWMCHQHLETFNRFYEKIHEIQEFALKGDYTKIRLHPRYETNSTTQKEIQSDSAEEENVIQVLFVSDGNVKAEEDNDTEEFELLEVDNLDSESFNEKAEVLFDENGEPNYQSLAIDEINSNEERTKRKHAHFTRSHKPTTSTAAISATADQFEKGKEITNTRRSTRVNKSVATIEIKKSPSKRVKRATVLSDSNNDHLKDVSVSKKKQTRQSNLRIHEANATENSDGGSFVEGESEDEFPARDLDNEDWPSQETLDEFPERIIENGLLLVKGKKLMSMICRFYKLDCRLCHNKTRFKQLRDLFNHYTSNHSEDGYVECCQTKLFRYPAIIMHMARHLQPDAFKCDECGYIVTRPRFLESHKQTHLPDAEKPYACNQCSRRFCWKSALRIHLISHQPVGERRLYVCHVCGRSYDTPGGLSTHKKLAHSERKVVESNVCHICAKNFATRTGLQEHMLTIHQPREKGQIQCTECGKWLMNNRCLKSHMVLHSDVEFRCDQCDYVTKKKVLLTRHQLTQHSDEKPFVCNLCGRAYKLKRALTVHIAQHGSTTTYQCPFCDRKFNSSTNFYAHRKNSHPKELQEMNRRAEEEKRQRRIEAGVENDESMVSENEIVLCVQAENDDDVDS